MDKTNDLNARPDLTAKPLPPTRVPLRERFIFTRRRSKTYHPLCSASGHQAALSQRYTSASKLSCRRVLFGAPCSVQNRNYAASPRLSGCWSSNHLIERLKSVRSFGSRDAQEWLNQRLHLSNTWNTKTM